MPGLQPEDHEIDGMEFSSHHLAVSWRQRQHQQPSTLTSSLSPASSQPRFDCGETAFQEGRWKGLSGLSLKIHEPFLGEGVTAMPPPYPTLGLAAALTLTFAIQFHLFRRTTDEFTTAC